MTAHDLLTKYRTNWQAMNAAGLSAEIALWEGTPRGEALATLAKERAPDAFAQWADGLMNSTAGDVMQPVERDTWADGMGDGNG